MFRVSLLALLAVGIFMLTIANPAAAAKLGKGVYAVFNTSMGTFTVKLFPDKAPTTVANFVGLATGTREYRDAKTGQMRKGKYFDGVIFHRVIKGFMIQGGDPAGTGHGGPGYKFANEDSDLTFSKPGILAMANAGRNTNGSQFFITVSVRPSLNGGYTIFGEVIEGYDIVEKISQTPTDPGDRPTTPVVIKSLEIKKIE